MSPQSDQPGPVGGVEALPKREIADLLADARARTLALVEPVSDEDLNRVHNPLMSPLVWDLGHIAAFEDLWLCRHVGRLELLRADLADVYDAAETPRPERGDLPYLRRDEAIDYMEAVRARALEVLERSDTQVGASAPGGTGTHVGASAPPGTGTHVGASAPPGTGDDSGPIWDMIVQHEQQHNETMLQTLQLAEPGVFVPRRAPAAGGEAAGGSVLVEAGSFAMGVEGGGFAYDNERPRHEARTGAFRIDRAPVTCAAYREFVEDGGYRRRELWSKRGWEQREREGWERPLYWTADGRLRSFERSEPLPEREPVMNVSFFEAEAYARWRGARLPSEAEWERAAWLLGDGVGQLDQLHFGPGPAGPFVGDCWEWTASDFEGYPGFEPWPYPEYSEVFFGADYKVLRGGSWATRPRVARVSFRNWDHPQRRQIFAGFRCAEDVR